MDHGHYTGKYRSTAHIICKLKFNFPNEIPVFFHNGSNYDYHFIIKEVFPFQQKQKLQKQIKIEMKLQLTL